MEILFELNFASFEAAFAEKSVLLETWLALKIR